MVSRILLCIFVAALLGSVSLAAAQSTLSPELAWIQPHMEALFADALQEMAAQGIPEEATDVVVIDAAIMYQYSRDKGVRPILLLEPDANGIIHFSDGGTMLAPPESPYWAEPTMWPDEAGALGSEYVEYLPYRRVTSLAGYSWVQGHIKVPEETELEGVDGVEGHAEGAFNYFGIKRAGVFDVEMGLATQFNEAKGWHDNKTWRSFHSSLPGYQWDRDWPLPDGLPPGTPVFLQMWVPADNQVAYYVSADGFGEYTHTYNLSGTKKDGSHGQACRRVTSMDVWGPAKSLNNQWSQVLIGTYSSRHPWAGSDTVLPTEATEYVTFWPHVRWSCETVSIEIP